jgi:hypothetical protein
LGALAAGLPAAFQGAFGLDQVTAFQGVFGGYILLSLIAALLYGQLSPDVEVATGEAAGSTLRLPSANGS